DRRRSETRGRRGRRRGRDYSQRAAAQALQTKPRRLSSGHPRILLPTWRNLPVYEQSSAVRSTGTVVPAAAGIGSLAMKRLLSKYWFPAALVLLLLMALPGIVLLALHLLGREAAVSAWLQENWGVSYHLPVPWWAGIVLVLVPLLLVLL